MDGANRWQQFRNVTLPGLQPVLAFVTMTTIIASANMFGQSYLITQGAPGTETRTAIYQIAETGLRNYPDGQRGGHELRAHVLPHAAQPRRVLAVPRPGQVKKQKAGAPLKAAPMMLRQGRG